MDVKLPHVRNRGMYAPAGVSLSNSDIYSPINSSSTNKRKTNLQQSKSQDTYSLPPTEVSFRNKKRNSSPKHVPVRISLVYPHVLKPPENKRSKTLSNDEIYKTEENFEDSDRSNTPIHTIKEEAETSNNNSNENNNSSENNNKNEDVVLVKEEDIKEEEVDNFPDDFRIYIILYLYLYIYIFK